MLSKRLAVIGQPDYLYALKDWIGCMGGDKNMNILSEEKLFVFQE